MSERDWAAERFEEHRPRLRAIAHRILGSPSEADDAVQEAWLRFSRSDTSGVDSLGAWLTTVVSRVCLNMLQARTTHAQPVAGPAPPEPRAEPAESDPEYEALLADSVRHALLVVLDTLTPAERVAFVLHDVFAIPFEEIAPIVGRSGPARPATRQPGPRACGGRTPAPGQTRSVMPRWSTPSSPPRARATRRPAEGPGPRRRAPRRPARRRAGRAGGDARAGAGRHVLAPGPGRGGRCWTGRRRPCWTPAGRPRVVYSFTTAEDGITAIDLVADPDRVRRMDLHVILQPARS